MKKINYMFFCLVLCCISVSCNRERSSQSETLIKFDVSRDTVSLNMSVKDEVFTHFVRNDTVFFIAYDNSDTMYVLRYDNSCDCMKEHAVFAVQDTVFGSNEQFGSIQKFVSITDSLFWFYKSKGKGWPHDFFLYDFAKDKVVCKFITTQDDFRDHTIDFLIMDQFAVNAFNQTLVAYVYSIDNECASLYYDEGLPCFLTEIGCQPEMSKTFIQADLPQIYRNIKNGDYSFDSFVYITQGHDSIIVVSFALSGQILLLNGKTLEYQYVEPEHVAYKTPIKNDMSKIEYMYDNFLRNAYRTFAYYELIYNPFRQEYYRFYQSEMPDKREDGTFTTAEDVQGWVFVMTKDFEPIGDFLFSEDDMFVVFLQNIVFPTPKGFVSYHVTDEGEIVFVRFEMQ
jgi:hypothetical protein